jgi:hypothetical protein
MNLGNKGPAGFASKGYAMKRITITLLVLAFVAGAVATPDAEAGLFKKDKSKRTEKPDWMKKPHRYDNAPRMSFHSGVLQQDGWTGWKLGELKLQLAKDCFITSDGVETGTLDAGRQAFVMGPRVGDTIVAWSVRVNQQWVPESNTYDSNVELKKSEANPNCGEITRGPQ